MNRRPPWAFLAAAAVWALAPVGGAAGDVAMTSGSANVAMVGPSPPGVLDPAHPCGVPPRADGSRDDSDGAGVTAGHD